MTRTRGSAAAAQLRVAPRSAGGHWEQIRGAYIYGPRTTLAQLAREHGVERGEIARVARVEAWRAARVAARRRRLAAEQRRTANARGRAIRAAEAFLARHRRGAPLRPAALAADARRLRAAIGELWSAAANLRTFLAE